MKSLHIKFTDGSNPWFLMNRTNREIQNAIRRWKRHYNIVDKYEENDIIYLILTEK